MSSQQFIEWLQTHLNLRDCHGCRWIDKNEKTFEILWPRADRSTGRERLGIMYKWWTHKFGDTRTNDQPTAIKGNFRSCLNSKVQSHDIIKITRLNRHTENEDWKAFKFTENDNPRLPRTRRVPRYTDDPGTGSETDSQVGWDTSAFEAREEFGQKVIKDQREEMLCGSRVWSMEFKAMGKHSMKLKTIDIKFDPTMPIQKKRLVYLLESKHQEHLHAIANKKIPHYSELYRKQLIEEVSIPIRDPQHSINTDARGNTIPDYFCPGFLLEVDNNFDIYITRLSGGRMYYGCAGETNSSSNWVKLEAKIQQKVFSYDKFLHRLYACEAMLTAIREGRLEQQRMVEPIKPTVYISMLKEPEFERGVSDCEYYFQIIHKPAESQYVSVFPATPDQWDVSDDMAQESNETMRRYQEFGDNTIEFSDDFYQNPIPTPQIVNLPSYDPKFVHPAQMQTLQNANPYSPQSSALQGNAFSPQGNAFSPQGNAFSPQGNAFSPQGNAFSPQGNAFSPQGNAFSPQNPNTFSPQNPNTFSAQNPNTFSAQNPNTFSAQSSNVLFSPGRHAVNPVNIPLPEDPVEEPLLGDRDLILNVSDILHDLGDLQDSLQ